MIKEPRFQIVKQFFPMVASGSLAGSAGSWALWWAAVQACHMVRLDQAGHAVRHCSCSHRHQRTIALHWAWSCGAKVPLEQHCHAGVWRKLAALKASSPSHLHASASWLRPLKSIPLTFRGLGWVGKLGQLWDSSPARKPAFRGSEGAALRKESLWVCSLRPLCPAQANDETAAVACLPQLF